MILYGKRNNSLNFLHIRAIFWTNWALSLCSTAHEVADGVLDQVGPRYLKNMGRMGNSTDRADGSWFHKKTPS